MNQLCRVCGEPAAGFHFGAFTCEGCKSFFGRTCNNVTSLGDCKNGGICVITRKNRTACKSCRLRKCLVVGMSKSGSRYGRRSNWFKIHCLLQDQPNQDSELSPEKAKMLIEELKGAKSKSGDVKEETSDNEENCSSSPTVTSSEIQDSNETHQFPILNWLHQTGQVPPETIPFLSAISPLIITHGLGIQTNNPTAQLANLSQYYPYLLSLMSSGAFQDDPSKPNPSSPTAFANGNDRCHPFYQTALHFKRDLQLPNPRNLTPTSSNSDDVEVTCHDESYLISQECRRLGEVPSDILPTGKLEGGNRIAPKQEIPKLKALFIDRMKRSLSPVDTDSSFKRRRRKSSLSEDELEVKIKEKSHLLQETNRNHRKSSEQCSGNVNSVQEQIEPIDLSIKTCSVNSKNNCTLTTPDNDSICSNVLACSMTLTPLTNFPSFHLSTNNLDEQKVLSSDPPEEQSSSVTSAIDLSC